MSILDTIEEISASSDDFRGVALNPNEEFVYISGRNLTVNNRCAYAYNISSNTFVAHSSASTDCGVSFVSDAVEVDSDTIRVTITTGANYFLRSSLDASGGMSGNWLQSQHSGQIHRGRGGVIFDASGFGGGSNNALICDNNEDILYMGDTGNSLSFLNIARCTGADVDIVRQVGLIDMGTFGVGILNISNSSGVNMLATLDVVSDSPSSTVDDTIAYHGDTEYLYVAQDSEGVGVYDTSNVFSIVNKTFISLSGVQSVDIYGDILYVASASNLYAYDISVADSPVLLDTLTISTSAPMGLSAGDDRVVVGGSNVTLVDVTDLLVVDNNFPSFFVTQSATNILVNDSVTFSVVASDPEDNVVWYAYDCDFNQNNIINEDFQDSTIASGINLTNNDRDTFAYVSLSNSSETSVMAKLEKGNDDLILTHTSTIFDNDFFLEFDLVIDDNESFFVEFRSLGDSLMSIDKIYRVGDVVFYDYCSSPTVCSSGFNLTTSSINELLSLEYIVSVGSGGGYDVLMTSVSGSADVDGLPFLLGLDPYKILFVENITSVSNSVGVDNLLLFEVENGFPSFTTVLNSSCSYSSTGSKTQRHYVSDNFVGVDYSNFDDTTVFVSSVLAIGITGDLIPTLELGVEALGFKSDASKSLLAFIILLIIFIGMALLLKINPFASILVVILGVFVFALIGWIPAWVVVLMIIFAGGLFVFATKGFFGGG